MTGENESRREAAERLHERTAELRERSAALVSRTAGSLRRLDERVVELVRSRPMIALGTAVATGYVIGRIASRRG